MNGVGINQSVVGSSATIRTFSDAKGNTYKGEMLNGVQHGWGKFTSVDDGYVYEGDFLHGEMTGWGSITFPDGDHYEGDVLNGEFHGRGTLTDLNSKYVGEWRYGERHGVGTITWKGGSSYQGAWQSDLKHGHGELCKRSRMFYKGEFKDGTPCGPGRVTFFASGNTYEGEFKDGCLYGKGNLISTTSPLVAHNNPDLAKHRECAQYGLEQCQSRYPLGGINKKEIYDAMQNEPDFKTRLDLVKWFARALKIEGKGKRALTPIEAKEKKLAADNMKGATCDILAFLTRDIIATRYPDVNVEVVQTEGHSLVVVGRPLNSDPNNIGTWDGAVMCDPWALMHYPAYNFDEMRVTSPDIPHYKIGLSMKGYTAELSTQHYLFGNPVVVFPVPHAN